MNLTREVGFQEIGSVSPARCGEARFPLTLTLSRREREQPLDTFLLGESLEAEFSHRLAGKLGAILPLRVGGIGGADGERAG